MNPGRVFHSRLCFDIHGSVPFWTLIEQISVCSLHISTGIWLWCWCSVRTTIADVHSKEYIFRYRLSIVDQYKNWWIFVQSWLCGYGEYDLICLKIPLTGFTSANPTNVLFLSTRFSLKRVVRLLSMKNNELSLSYSIVENSVIFYLSPYNSTKIVVITSQQLLCG